MQHCFLLSQKWLRFLGSAMGIAIANHKKKNRCDFGALRVGMYKYAKVYADILPKGRYEGGKAQKTQFQNVNLLWALWVAPTFSLSGLPSAAMLVFGLPVWGHDCGSRSSLLGLAFTPSHWIHGLNLPSAKGYFTERKSGYFTEGKSGQCFRFFETLVPVMSHAKVPKPSWRLPPLNLTPLFRDPDSCAGKEENLLPDMQFDRFLLLVSQTALQRSNVNFSVRFLGWIWKVNFGRWISWRKPAKQVPKPHLP